MKYRGVPYPDMTLVHISKLLATRHWQVTVSDPELLALKRGRTVWDRSQNCWRIFQHCLGWDIFSGLVCSIQWTEGMPAVRPKGTEFKTARVVYSLSQFLNINTGLYKKKTISPFILWLGTRFLTQMEERKILMNYKCLKRGVEKNV
jgi:hypothetical protein